MKKTGPGAGVLGWPIAHSLSPRLHNYWLKEYGIAGSYEALAVAPEQLEDTLRRLPEQGFRGVNLTIPHKEKALGIVNHVEPLARRAGAVNTIVVRAGGALEGRNTDVFGFMQNLRAAGIDVRDKPVTVLGAGGAARAVIVALQELGAGQIKLANRTREKAETLRRELGAAIQVLPWNDRSRALGQTALLVNTTSLGMQSGAGPAYIELGGLPEDAVVADIVYTPLVTGLLQDARARGHRIVDGLGMLLYQAQPAFEAWFGVRPEVTPALRAHMIEAL